MRGPVQLAEYLTTADPATCHLSHWQEHIDTIGQRMAQRFFLMCPEGAAHPNYARFLDDCVEDIRVSQRRQLEGFKLDQYVVAVAETAIIDAFLAAVRRVYATASPGGLA